MKNLLLKVQYDGSNYEGWQSQPSGNTIQQKIEKAIFEITGERVKIIGSGRTDSGVHAKGQYCNFMSVAELPIEKMPGAFNSALPRDIRIIKSEEVPLDFHARYSAIKKKYSYHIDNNGIYNPLFRRYAYHIPQPLIVEEMEKASGFLLGSHDFRAFMSKGSSIKTTIREVKDIKLKSEDNFLIFTIAADGFLYNMVRIIIGTLVEIGLGKLDSEIIREMIITGNRNIGGPTAPPHGLFLEEVYYP